MGTRKATPDILGALLGGSKPAAPETPATPPKPAKAAATQPQKEATPPLPPPTAPDPEPQVADTPEYGEGLLSSAAAKIKAAGKVLDRQRIVDWLDQMQLAYGRQEPQGTSENPESALEYRAAEWAQRHLKAVATATSYHANGLKDSKPYEIDVWAHLKGEGFRPDLDVWIDCRREGETVTKEDILEFVKKGTDIYHAAHTERQEFWFDRLMFVSLQPFDEWVLEAADEYGVVCVWYDRTSFLIQSDPYWKLKPRWFREAESSQIS